MRRVLLALALVACADDPPRQDAACAVGPPSTAPAVASLGFTEEDAGGWGAAAFAWDQVVVPERWVTCAVPWCAVGDERWTLTKTPPQLPYIGSADRASMELNVGSGFPAADYRAFAKHELGHAIGLKHTATGVMAERIETEEFTTDVMAECRRVGACP
jgi:hypothetical protein